MLGGAGWQRWFCRQWTGRITQRPLRDWAEQAGRPQVGPVQGSRGERQQGVLFAGSLSVGRWIVRRAGISRATAASVSRRNRHGPVFKVEVATAGSSWRGRRIDGADEVRCAAGSDGAGQARWFCEERACMTHGAGLCPAVPGLAALGTASPSSRRHIAGPAPASCEARRGRSLQRRTPASPGGGVCVLGVLGVLGLGTDWQVKVGAKQVKVQILTKYRYPLAFDPGPGRAFPR